MQRVAAAQSHQPKQEKVRINRLDNSNDSLDSDSQSGQEQSNSSAYHDDERINADEMGGHSQQKRAKQLSDGRHSQG